MRLHRFYVNPGDDILEHDFWFKDAKVLNQWVRVLRYKAGDEVVLFDGIQHERLYRITEMGKSAAHLELVTEFERKLPERHVYLLWAMLKKDKNDWVIQKATELGVTNLVPVVADRSEKTGFNLERARKIAIEAAEQCGRSDIPDIREPVEVSVAVEEYAGNLDLLVCDERDLANKKTDKREPAGVLIGPEGGWSLEEMKIFKDAKLGSLHLGSLTLRAETAAVVAAAKLLV
jgi:16S rRNA (uracil1498-N3)-methyltransferase